MGSYSKILKAIFYLLKGEYRVSGLRLFFEGVGFRIEVLGFRECRV